MRRMFTAMLVLALGGCASPPTAEDLCRDSARCAPACGSVATGGSPECDPWQREGRTRG